MERIISGTMVRDSQSFSSKADFWEASLIVKKGHEECGDSAFIYSDANKVIVGVFDGVSGAAHAASASSKAARAVLDHLKTVERANKKDLQDALLKANLAIDRGYTTASIMLVMKNGSFAVAVLGDSPVYGIDYKGDVTLEMPMGRVVKDNDSIVKFFHFRNYVVGALGPTKQTVEARIAKGKLKKGEVVLIASDGLSDNLFLLISEGYVIDSSGTQDLKALIGTEREPGKIVSLLAKEIAKRIGAGRVEKQDSIMIPKQDDLAIAAFRFK